jgi:Ankyrin repeats (3 copies)/Ankyrin repeat
MRAMALDIESRPRTASEMRALLHDKASAVPYTVPTAATDETTRVSAAPTRAEMPVEAAAPQRRPGPPVVVPVPEETWVAKKQTGTWKRFGVSAVVIVGLFAVSAVLYLSLSGGGNKRLESSTPRVVVSITPPTRSPTPAESPSPQPFGDGAAVVGPDELAARERLAQKKIPFSEEAFTRAVEEGDTGAVELLLAAGMSPEVRDVAGRTALITAASRGRNHVSQELLSRGADVNARDADGSTALMQSALAGHQETTDVLLRSGADVNLNNNQGQTALILAAARGHADIVRKLLDRGAKVELRDRNGRDALTWAEVNNKSEVADLLRKARGAKP